MRHLSVGLIAVFIWSGSLATTPKNENLKSERTFLSSSLVDFSEYFKNKDFHQAKTIANHLNLQLIKEVKKDISKNCVLDSLVFQNENLGIWTSFKSVDLGYLSNMESFMVIRTEHCQLLAEQIRNELLKRGKREQVYETNSIQFMDTSGAIAIDDRFKLVTYQEIKSLYKYSISIQEDFLIFQITETIPARVLKKVEPKELSKALSMN